MAESKPKPSNVGRPTIWNRTARDLLFERVVAKFGPYSTWKNARSPGGGRDQEFDEFCENFAKTVGAESGGAVKMQIAFGMPVSGESNWDQGHARSAILCLAAAFEAGFITSADFPNLIARGREGPSLEDL